MKKRKCLPLVLSLCLAGVLTSCQNDDPIQEEKLELTLKLGTTSLEVGQVTQLSVVASIEGTSYEIIVSDDSVVKVEGSNVKALKEGTATLQAKSGEVVSNTVKITVKAKEGTDEEEPDPLTVSIEVPEKTTLKVSESINLTAKVENNVDNLPLEWASSDETILTVDTSGKVTGVKEGKAKVTLKVGDVTSAPLELTVEKEEEVEPPVQKISVEIKDPANSELEIGESLQLEAEVKNNVDNLPVEWSSSDVEVLSVSSSGLVTALKEGEAIIKAKVGDAEDTVSLKVVKKEIVATDIEYTLRKTTIGVGEKLEIETRVLPEGADQTVTVTSSNELAVRVDGKTIEGLSVTEEEAPVTITISTPNGITKSIQITVVEMGKSALSEIEAVLTKSAEIEKTAVKSGSYSIVKTDATGEVSESHIGNYDIYSDNKVRIHDEEDWYGVTITDRSIGLTEDEKTYYDIYQETDEYGEVKITYDTEILEVSETGDGYSSIKLEDAKNNLTLPTILDKRGLSNQIFEEYFNGSGYYSDEEAQKSMTFDYADGVYALSAFGEESWDGSIEKYETTIKVDEEGLVTSFNQTKSLFSADYDTGEVSDTADEVETVEFTLEKGAREVAPNDLLTIEDLYLTDYECHLSNTYYGTEQVNEYVLGSTVYLIVDSYEPETYYDDIDPIEIVSVSDPSAVENLYGTSFKVVKPIDELEVTVASEHSKIEKTFTISVYQPEVETISLPSEKTTLPLHDLVGATREISVSSSPSGSIADIDVNVIPGTGDADVSLVEGSTNSFTITGTKPGTVTLEVTDKNVGETSKVTREITYFDNSDEGIMEYLSSSSIYCNKSDFTITITKDEANATEGLLTVVYDDGWSTYTSTAKIVVSNGEITFSDFVGLDDDEYLITELRPYDYDSSAKYSRFNLTMQMSWDESTVSFYIY